MSFSENRPQQIVGTVPQGPEPPARAYDLHIQYSLTERFFGVEKLLLSQVVCRITYGIELPCSLDLSSCSPCLPLRLCVLWCF